MGFFRDLLRAPTWVVIWVFALMAVNVAAVAFWDEQLARLILVTFLLSALLMMALYAKFGFEKILGLGHILWVPLVMYVITQFPRTGGAFRAYLAILTSFLIVSLIFDFVDVCRYVAASRSRKQRRRVRSAPEVS
jgi:hypothetical protein